MSLLTKMMETIRKGNRQDIRDRRGHYASGNLSCLRDQYWSWMGEPETNSTDYVGASKMLVGSAVEDALVKAFSALYRQGVNLSGTQIACGGSNPAWNGYMDIKLSAANGDLIVEVKTKSGYGADLFWTKPDPSPEYLTQLALYLRDSVEKGGTKYGAFLFFLLSDKTFGSMVIINCEYRKEDKTMYAISYERSDGETGDLNLSLDTEKALDRWRKLDEHIATKTVPEPEYRYRYPVTPETLEALSDAKLRKVMDGTLVLGDWQVKYSRYKNKQLQVDGISQEISEEAKQLARDEYRKRHPKSKL